MIQFKNLSLRRGTKLLFEQASFQIHPGQKVGVTGANGTGKSSLFALILDELHADSGDCLYPKDWVIAHVAQETPADQRPALEYVLDGDAELRKVEAKIARAETGNEGLKLATLHSHYENIGGYTAASRAGQLLYGLGFKAGDENRAVNEYSGGWRMRLNLAKALMCRSDLLLLDEPTNHLDLDAVIWLENWLSAYAGTLLLISHDRDFLNNVTTHIAHLEHQRVTLYTGNYSTFERLRAEHLAHQQAGFEKQQREIKHIQSYVERFRAQATKARQAQSRLKALERMEEIAPAHVDSPFHFSLLEPEKRPNTLLRLEAVSAGYADTAIIDDVDLIIVPGDRIGLLGPNGAGKSTLIKLLAGSELDSSINIHSGQRELAKETKIGYFAQHQLEQLHPEHSPVEHLKQLDPNAREADLRNHLGGFGFSNDMALSPVAPFSGGEKSRLVLAMLVYQRPNLLLLDEPTNHLDLEMRQALATALQDFTGAMIIVSHDRHLLRVTCDQLLLVHDHCVSEFPFSMDEYPKWLSEQNKIAKNPTEGATAIEAPDANNASAKKDKKRQQAELRKKLQPLSNKVKKAETELDKLHAKQNELEQQLADTDIYNEHNKEKLQACLLKKADLDQRCEAVESQWLEITEELEALSSSG
ncbi:MAG: ATP-binding cassette domain-containing protein [Gammaproteobacteria bacterium]|jgi:ATP-binding cassette subfamily F protein 3|nr:ATP-binding cassette domain-containing protein [Gammaproteobacteria bacterium]